KRLKDMGFNLCATSGTADFLNNHDLGSSRINKVKEGSPHCVESIKEGKFAIVINTVSDEQAVKDSFSIRRAALERKIPYSTVVSAARAMIEAIHFRRDGPLEILPLQKEG
ncbi:MAG: carbamoyl phosphate synthase large subunit, partial [Bdellovibrionota bacterium]